MTADTIVRNTPTPLFNHVAINSPLPLGPEVTFAIRKDALFATDLLIRGLSALPAAKSGRVKVTDVVSDAYRDWGHSVLKSFAQHLDYDQYDTKKGMPHALRVMFFGAGELAKSTIQNAYDMAQPHLSDKGIPLLVSLDDMITKEDGSKFPEIAFSRLFTLDGEEKDYVARPGHKPVAEQIQNIAQLAKEISIKTGQRTPIVLLEDNVRRAKMLNWVIDLMDKHGVFAHADLVGISTSFCNATQAERNNIKYNGRIVPVAAVKDCDTNYVIDVATTRDLMFDGFVTEFEGTIGRLPGIFMDVAKRFKIAPDRADDFRREIINANIAFCNAIEKSFGIQPPLAWFDGGPIIAKIAGISINTPMVDLLRSTQNGMLVRKAANDDHVFVKAAKAGVPCYPPIP